MRRRRGPRCLRPEPELVPESDVLIPTGRSRPAHLTYSPSRSTSLDGTRFHRFVPAIDGSVPRFTIFRACERALAYSGNNTPFEVPPNGTTCHERHSFRASTGRSVRLRPGRDLPSPAGDQRGDAQRLAIAGDP